MPAKWVDAFRREAPVKPHAANPTLEASWHRRYRPLLQLLRCGRLRIWCLSRPKTPPKPSAHTCCVALSASAAARRATVAHWCQIQSESRRGGIAEPCNQPWNYVRQEWHGGRGINRTLTSLPCWCAPTRSPCAPAHRAALNALNSGEESPLPLRCAVTLQCKRCILH